jgi:hypothetical protein
MDAQTNSTAYTVSRGFDARGGGNIIRYNESFGNVGVGIRLGGDGADDGLNNQVYGNHISAVQSDERSYGCANLA